MKEREGFNFYKSYYLVYKELSQKDKLLFIDALLERQFNGIEPTLQGMANFAYISQKHNIDKQVKGWEDKTGCKLCTLPPAEGGCGSPPEGSDECPTRQEKGEEQEKGEGKVEIPAYDEFLTYAIEKKSDVNKEALSLKYQSWIENGWKDGNNKAIKNWKSKLLNTLPYLKDEKTRANNQRGFKSDTTRATIDHINNSFT